MKSCIICKRKTDLVNVTYSASVEPEVIEIRDYIAEFLDPNVSNLGIY